MWGYMKKLSILIVKLIIVALTCLGIVCCIGIYATYFGNQKEIDYQEVMDNETEDYPNNHVKAMANYVVDVVNNIESINVEVHNVEASLELEESELNELGYIFDKLHITIKCDNDSYFKLRDYMNHNEEEMVKVCEPLYDELQDVINLYKDPIEGIEPMPIKVILINLDNEDNEDNFNFDKESYYYYHLNFEGHRAFRAATN